MIKKLILFVAFMLLISLDAQAQCSMCRAVLESESGQKAAEGINDGIVYLMIFPYLLVGGVGYVIWRSRKKSKLEE